MQTSNNKPVSIGEAARLTSVSVKQVRHWHEREYIPAPEMPQMSTNATNEMPQMGSDHANQLI